MKETVIKNLKDVRTEAIGMLENVEAVRGEPYAKAVHVMLITTQVSEMVSHLCEMADEVNPVVTKVLAMGIGENLSRAVSIMVEELGIDGEKVQEVIADCKRINDNTHSLIESAITQGKDGKEFGSDNA